MRLVRALRPLLPLLIGGVVVLAVVAVVLFTHVGSSTAARPQASVSPTKPSGNVQSSPTPEPSASSTGASQGEDEDGVTTCKSIMSAADYSSFASRVVLFETLQLSPETQVRADQLKQYETSDYAKQNPAYVDPKAATNVVVTLKDAASSKFTCFDDDGITAYVALTPQVQTEQKDSDGTTTTKNPFFPYPVQTSIWTLQGDQWFLSGLT